MKSSDVMSVGLAPATPRSVPVSVYTFLFVSVVSKFIAGLQEAKSSEPQTLHICGFLDFTKSPVVER